MLTQLRAVWDEPRAAGAPARSWRDLVLVVVLVATVVAEGVVRADLPFRWPSTVLIAVLVPALLWRRSHPLVVSAGVFASLSVGQLLMGRSVEQDTAAFVLLVVVAVVRWGSGREVVAGTLVVLVHTTTSAAAGFLSSGDLVAGLAVVVAASAVGFALRTRSGARSRELDHVRVLERERLARDLHDTVAHHVSAIAIRAQAGLATAAVDPAAPTDALHVIEAEASRTLEEMRAMVRVLRAGEPTDLTPTPQVTDLKALASRDGVAVQVEILGDVQDLPPAVSAAVYRLAQESVTNARRHAREATAIRVRVTGERNTVLLSVTDDGTAASSGSPGYGLLGMRERARLLGGTCEAGPGPARGWTVTATLPRHGTPA